VSLDWFLSQVFSYVNHFYEALFSPDSLVGAAEATTEKEITEAMIFLVLSSAIGAAGFSFITRTQMDFQKDLITIGLLDILSMILFSVEVLIAWRLAGSKLPFHVFLRGCAYFVGVTTVLGMVVSLAFLGVVGGFRSESLAEARLAVWSVFVNPIEMLSDDFPNGWPDVIALILLIAVGATLLLLTWWRMYRRRSNLKWKHFAWAYVTFCVLSGLVFDVLMSFSLRRN
jgi:hypothetical protein